MTIEFKAWPKIPRLFRDCIITEKIDGTNAAVGIVRIEDTEELEGIYEDPNVMIFQGGPSVDFQEWAVYAQSRKKIITPEQDNAGFASWVYDNAWELIKALGEGLHFGEYWGYKIGRTYDLPKDDRRFSLFNVSRYKDCDFSELPSMGLVPVLYEGPFSKDAVTDCIEGLRAMGSQAAPGYFNPEGVITFHVAANQVFKTTLENDEKPKGSNEPG